MLEKTLESPLDCKEIQPVHPKGDQSWVFTGGTDAEADTPILWPPHVKSWLIGKDPDAGTDWGQEKKGTTEDEMVGWHHRLNGHEFGWAPGDGEGQESLAFCSSWGCRVEYSWASELNWTNALEKEMATHSSILAWRIPGTGEPGGLPFMGWHRVGCDWSDLAAAAAAAAVAAGVYVLLKSLRLDYHPVSGQRERREERKSGVSPPLQVWRSWATSQSLPVNRRTFVGREVMYKKESAAGPSTGGGPIRGDWIHTSVFSVWKRLVNLTVLVGWWMQKSE